jgi:hypothetical protein
MNHLPDSMGTVGNNINNIVAGADSVTGLLPKSIRDKIEQSMGRGSINSNLGSTMSSLIRNGVQGFNGDNIVTGKGTSGNIGDINIGNINQSPALQLRRFRPEICGNNIGH